LYITGEKNPVGKTRTGGRKKNPDIDDNMRALYPLFLAVTLAVGAAAALQLDKLPATAPGVLASPEITPVRSLPQMTVGARVHTLRFHGRLSSEIQSLVHEVNRAASDGRPPLLETVVLCHMTPYYEFLLKLAGREEAAVAVVPGRDGARYACQLRFEEARMRKSLGDVVRMNSGIITVEPCDAVVFMTGLNYDHKKATEEMMNRGDSDVAILVMHANRDSR
jgi:hypothetical protein